MKVNLFIYNTPVNGRNLLEVYSLGDQSYGNDDKILNVYDYGFTGNTISDGYMSQLKTSYKSSEFWRDDVQVLR